MEPQVLGLLQVPGDGLQQRRLAAGQPDGVDTFFAGLDQETAVGGAIQHLVTGGATEILISEAYRWAFSRQEQYGYAAAYATLIFLFLLAWSLAAGRLQRRTT